MAVTTGGLVVQELKVDENFKEMRTSFLSFQLLPEVPTLAVPSGHALDWPVATGHTTVSVSAGAALDGVCRV